MCSTKNAFRSPPRRLRSASLQSCRLAAAAARPRRPRASRCDPDRASLQSAPPAAPARQAETVFVLRKYLDHVMFVPSLSWQMIVFYRAKESEKGIRSVVCLSLHIPARRDRPAPLSRRAQRLVPGSDPPSGFPNKKFIPTVFGFLSGQMRKSLVVFVLLKTFCCVLPSSHPKAVVFKVRDLVNPA
jgi:hypothetical protein